MSLKEKIQRIRDLRKNKISIKKLFPYDIVGNPGFSNAKLNFLI
jgi:hypothetical protein